MNGSKKSSKDKNDWYQKPWAKISDTIITISTILGIGYAVGSFKENLDWKLEKILLNQEFNEKLQKQIDDCKQKQIQEYKLSSDEIERVINEINKRNNEK